MSFKDDLLKESQDYLQKLVNEHWITENLSQKGIDLLNSLLNRVNPLELPTIAPGPDNTFGFTWENERHYISISILSIGLIESYYEDLSKSGPTIFVESDTIPNSIIEKLELYFNK